MSKATVKGSALAVCGLVPAAAPLPAADEVALDTPCG